MTERDRTQIRIAGFGGQGVILAGQIMGKAACLFEGLHSTMIQSFGPEARGGACSAQVVISSAPVMFPYIKEADLLLVMSQEGYQMYAPRVKSGGIILYESDLVKPSDCAGDVEHYGIPATRFAEKIRSKILLNIVMLGFFSAFCNVVSADAMQQVIISSVPRGTENFNLLAFGKGYEYGMELKLAREEKGKF